MQVLASLEDVWLFLKVLLDDSKLQQFKFLLSWDRMNEKEKMRLPSFVGQNEREGKDAIVQQVQLF